MNFAINYFVRVLFIFNVTFVTCINYVYAQNSDMAFSLVGADDIDIHSMTQSKDGNILLVGSFKGTKVDFNPSIDDEFRDSPNSYNAFIASYSPEGQYNWVQTIGEDANIKFYDIAVNANGLIYVCGSASGSTIDLDPGTSSTNHQLPENTTGMVVACYSQFGTYRWGFIIPAEYNWQLQSSISPNKLELDFNGNIFIAGSFQTTNMDLDPGLGVQPYSTKISESDYNYDAFLVKYTQNGNYIWSTAIQSDASDNCQSVVVDGKGNSYLCGSFSGENTKFSSGSGNENLRSAGETDLFISKYDASGNLLWAKNMGGSDIDQVNDIKLDADTNIYITGVYKGTVDMDAGEKINELTSRGNFDIFFAKYDKNGEIIFAKSIGSDEYDNVFNMAISSYQDIFLTGYYKARADNDFDPGDAIKKLTTDSQNGNNFLFVTHFNLDGTLNWATSGTCAEGIYGNSVLPIEEGTTLISGHFNGSFGSIPALGNNLFQLADEGKTGVFLAKVSTETSSSVFNKRKSILTVYPNPVTTTIHLQTDIGNNSYLDYNVSLYNIAGNLIHQDYGSLEKIENGLNQLILNLNRGSYFIKMNTNDEVLNGNFIKN